MSSADRCKSSVKGGSVLSSVSKYCRNMETTAASNGDLSKETPTKEFNYLILLVLLVVPIAALVIGLVICKLKSCGPWKKSDEYEKPPRDEESPEQETPLVTGEKENLRKSVELDENEKVEEEAVELEEEGKTTNENAEEPLIKEEKEEKHSDDNEEEEDDKEKAEEGNDSSSEQKDGDITEATPGNRSEKAPIIATDQSAAQ
ncbi:glutamic acid-rich protein-like [Pomacea canaliculata]|uniref:glutamic acid-rich protein-like n=1 Tax=Pomacea canaliculata TaxID=400727 RepID=UPI000D73F4BB|nr:glutamic acid-rich protein-like [Pomacea canaliculata]